MFTKRKICFVTGNRAEYSRIKTVLQYLSDREDIEFRIVVTGSHLLSRYGNTAHDIEADGFVIDHKIYSEVEGGNPTTMAKSVSVLMGDLVTYFDNRRPDIVVVLMDRYEHIAVATACALMNIPMAHMQGGEVSGTIDETVRHVITKCAHLHFAATAQSAERIIKMGELPNNVYNVGDPASDVLLHIPVVSAQICIQKLNEMGNTIPTLRPYILAQQHPVTTEFVNSAEQIRESLLGLAKFSKYTVIFLYPNIDAGGVDIHRAMNECKDTEGLSHIYFFTHIQHDLFVNLMRNASCMFGNSSAGIRESCYFGTPTVNVGTRQTNRERGKNVMDAGNNRDDIARVIQLQLDHGRYEPEWLYGDGTSGQQIADLLVNIDLATLRIQKSITY